MVLQGPGNAGSRAGHDTASTKYQLRMSGTLLGYLQSPSWSMCTIQHIFQPCQLSPRLPIVLYSRLTHLWCSLITFLTPVQRGNLNHMIPETPEVPENMNQVIMNHMIIMRAVVMIVIREIAMIVMREIVMIVMRVIAMIVMRVTIVTVIVMQNVLTAYA